MINSVRELEIYYEKEFDILGFEKNNCYDLENEYDRILLSIDEGNNRNNMIFIAINNW